MWNSNLLEEQTKHWRQHPEFRFSKLTTPILSIRRSNELLASSRNSILDMQWGFSLRSLPTKRSYMARIKRAETDLCSEKGFTPFDHRQFQLHPIASWPIIGKEMAQQECSSRELEGLAPHKKKLLRYKYLQQSLDACHISSKSLI